MNLHHRAVIMGWNNTSLFVQSVYDIGFPWNTKWQDSESVMKVYDEMLKKYENVKVEVRDAG